VLLWLAEQCPPGLEFGPFLDDNRPQDLTRNSLVKLVLTDPNHECGPRTFSDVWSGHVESPLFPIYARPYDEPNLAGTLRAPDEWPGFSPIPFRGGAIGENASLVTRLWSANRTLIARLDLYEPNAIRRELEKRMGKETNIHMRLLMGSLAARRGSTAARDFLVECRQITDHDIAWSTIDAIESSTPWGRPHTPWAEKALEAARKDRREVRHLGWENQEGPALRIADLMEPAGERWISDPNERSSPPPVSAQKIEELIGRLGSKDVPRGKPPRFGTFGTLAAGELRACTGVLIGCDPVAWRRWWVEKGRHEPRFRPVSGPLADSGSRVRRVASQVPS
jgi:hypothetical protein